MGKPEDLVVWETRGWVVDWWWKKPEDGWLIGGGRNQRMGG